MWEDMLNDKLGMNCFNLYAEHVRKRTAFVISVYSHRRVALLKQWQEIDQFRLSWQPKGLHFFGWLLPIMLPLCFKIYLWTVKIIYSIMQSGPEWLNGKLTGSEWTPERPDNKLKCSTVVMTLLLQSKWCLEEKKKEPSKLAENANLFMRLSPS